MELRNTLEHINEKTLRSRYGGKGVVTYKGEVVLEDGELKDTPLAREWWRRKFRNNVK